MGEAGPADQPTAATSCSQQVGQVGGVGAHLRQTWRGLPGFDVADELLQQLGPEDLNRVSARARRARTAASARRTPRWPTASRSSACTLVVRLAIARLSRDSRTAAEPRGSRRRDGTAGAATRGALGCEQTAPIGARNAALDQEDVGFLARLQNAELGVGRGEIGHEPIRVRSRAASAGGRHIPGGPSVGAIDFVDLQASYSWGIDGLSARTFVERGVVVIEATALGYARDPGSWSRKVKILRSNGRNGACRARKVGHDSPLPPVDRGHPGGGASPLDGRRNYVVSAAQTHRTRRRQHSDQSATGVKRISACGGDKIA